MFLQHYSAEMAEITEEAFDNTIYNTQTDKLAEIHFLKPSWLISSHGRISIASIDHVSQIMIHTFTLFHVDGEHGKSTAPLITSSCSRNHAVKKQSDPSDEDGNSDNNNDNEDEDEGGPFVSTEHGETSGINRYSSDEDEEDDEDEDAGDNSGGEICDMLELELEPVKIHQFESRSDGSTECKGVINTELKAGEYNSYRHFASAIHHFWLDENGLSHENAPEIAEMNRFNCWPGAEAMFGVYNQRGEFMGFNWRTDDWHVVRTLITDVKVVRYIFRPRQAEQGNNNWVCIGKFKQFVIKWAIGLALLGCIILAFLVLVAMLLWAKKMKIA